MPIDMCHKNVTPPLTFDYIVECHEHQKHSPRSRALIPKHHIGGNDKHLCIAERESPRNQQRLEDDIFYFAITIIINSLVRGQNESIPINLRTRDRPTYECPMREKQDDAWGRSKYDPKSDLDAVVYGHTKPQASVLKIARVWPLHLATW